MQIFYYNCTDRDILEVITLGYVDKRHNFISASDAEKIQDKNFILKIVCRHELATAKETVHKNYVDVEFSAEWNDDRIDKLGYNLTKLAVKECQKTAEKHVVFGR